jgi:hypothetical protein
MPLAADVAQQRDKENISLTNVPRGTIFTKRRRNGIRALRPAWRRSKSESGIEKNKAMVSILKNNRLEFKSRGLNCSERREGFQTEKLRSVPKKRGIL